MLVIWKFVEGNDKVSISSCICWRDECLCVKTHLQNRNSQQSKWMRDSQDRFKRSHTMRSDTSV